MCKNIVGYYRWVLRDVNFFDGLRTDDERTPALNDLSYHRWKFSEQNTAKCIGNRSVNADDIEFTGCLVKARDLNLQILQTSETTCAGREFSSYLSEIFQVQTVIITGIVSRKRRCCGLKNRSCSLEIILSMKQHLRSKLPFPPI